MKTRNYRTVCIYVGLLLATVLAFEQVRFNDFVAYDDDQYVTDNPHVSEGLTVQNIGWAFTTPHASNWHPLTWISHMLDCQLFGMNATWHHLHNLLLHLVNVLLLFELMRRMTGAIWRSAFVAAAFALHPMHVESVAWVSERKDVLSTLFWLLTTAAYLKYVKRPRISTYLPVIILLALGLMAKPMLVTLPLTLLLLDYWPLGRMQTRKSKLDGKEKLKQLPLKTLIAEKVPLLIVSLISCVITYVVQHKGGAMLLTEKGVAPLNIRIANAFVSYIAYIVKLFWPRNLAVLYPFPSAGLALYKPIAACVILILVTIVVIRIASRKPYLLTGWLWYVITLIPVIGIIHVGFQAYADRYTYLPYTGLFIIIAWAATDMFGRIKHPKGILSGLAVVLFAAMIMTTRCQVEHWKDSKTLFQNTLNVTRNNYIVYHNMGIEFAAEGKSDQAMEHYRKALQANPTYVKSLNNLGNEYKSLGKLDEAVDYYRQATEIDPTYAKAHYNLGVALGMLGNPTQAIISYRRALQIYPDNANFHNGLGEALASKGSPEAMTHFQKAIDAEPDHHLAQHNLGLELAARGNFDEALSCFQKTIAIEPGFAEAYNNIGNVFLMQKKNEQAIEYYRKTIKLNPRHPLAHYNLALVLESQGKIREAADHLRQYLEEVPDNESARQKLEQLMNSLE